MPYHDREGVSIGLDNPVQSRAAIYAKYVASQNTARHATQPRQTKYFPRERMDSMIDTPSQTQQVPIVTAPPPHRQDREWLENASTVCEREKNDTTNVPPKKQKKRTKVKAWFKQKGRAWVESMAYASPYGGLWYF